jgi:hypothetical protein
MLLATHLQRSEDGNMGCFYLRRLLETLGKQEHLKK